jgi:transcriptional adapter 2-alpha
MVHSGKGLPNGLVNGLVNGHHAVNGDVPKPEMRTRSEDAPDAAAAESGDAEEVTLPPPVETKESTAFKLTTIEMYLQRVEKRRESKAIMFERGLLEYKKVIAGTRPKSYC